MKENIPTPAAVGVTAVLFPAASYEYMTLTPFAYFIEASLPLASYSKVSVPPSDRIGASPVTIAATAIATVRLR